MKISHNARPNTSTEIRNDKISKLMEKLLAKASSGDFQVPQQTQNKLSDICNSSARGFREIVLVIGIAKLLDPKYSPTTKLYECNPRAIYEGPIRNALDKERIPRGKSGPLNIAKAQEGITDAWAAQRRPQRTAQLVVEITQQIEKAPSSDIAAILSALLAEMLKEAKRVDQYSIELNKEADAAYLIYLCTRMIDEVPDAGNTPQRIIGHLLEIYHKQIGSKGEVDGHYDKASVTSTTSKKPGDITETASDGKILAVYEVTVKPFEDQRASDSYEAVIEYAKMVEQDISEVIVICRTTDVHPDAKIYKDGTYLATLQYNGITYHFLEIHEWISAAVSRLNSAARLQFHSILNEYVAEPNTAEKVKILWKKLHEDL